MTQSSDDVPSEYQDILDELESNTKVLQPPQYSGVLRLSIRENIFRKVVGTHEEILQTPAIKVVIVKSAPISRTYYKGEYVAGQSNPPACWAADSETGRPSKEVPEDTRQASACFECKQNIKGSGVGQTRACRYQQRIAVLLADEDDKINPAEVYQLQLPATSLFGKDKQKMSMQTYARFLNSQEKPVPFAMLLTEIRFDEESHTPKLYFKPLRVLEEAEAAIAKEIQTHPDTEKLVTLKIAPTQDSYPNVDNVFGVVEGDGVYVRDL